MEGLKTCAILLLFLKILDETDGNCILSLTKDLAYPSPVLIKNGDYFLPSATGDLRLRRNEVVTIACVGTRSRVLLGNDTTDEEVIQATCISNTTFKVNNWRGVFSDIKCNTVPSYTTEKTKENCHSGKIYRIGYKIEGKLFKLYEACFDSALLTTSYVKHELNPSALYLQSGPRPQFSEGTLFGKIRISKLYGIKNQRVKFSEILGDGMDEKYINKKQFLARGHLAPRADFPLHALQRASFNYVNAAPQWMRGNGGDWASLEDGLRRRINNYKSPVTVYTGTHGVMTLTDTNGDQKEIYLGSDANNNYVVPIPLYFYKVIYDEKKQAAIAFISINSSFYNKTTIETLTFCDDISNELSWLKWRNDGMHSFACTYPQFNAHVKVLPQLKVKKVFI